MTGRLQQRARVLASTIYNFLFVQKSTVGKDALKLAMWLKRWLTTPLFLLALLAYILWPHPAKVIYAEPTSSKAPAPQLVRIAMAKKLPQPVVAPVAPVPEPAPPPQPVYVAPAPVVGCGSDTYKAFIYSHESGCNTASINRSSGACGLGQALPCSKMGCSLSDWACQDAFFTSYALGRYGSWYNAYLFWLSHSWW